ncbi:hypothetical protein L798_06644 [Zootermopsis nevadensis]|uniref:Uncharacterized protein n=1 Tax=Zootermopsis nevadensis TaxID=136037 RepID=A0A067R7M9_ZOONE|nr:hypothetical protein L798_06644 [Zootermopsis nevadensis]
MYFVIGHTLQPGNIQHAGIQSVMLCRLDDRMRETGSVLPTSLLGKGRPCTHRLPSVEEMWWQRGTSRGLGVEHHAVNLILRDEDLYSWVQIPMSHGYHHRL